MADDLYLLGIDFGTGGARVGIFDPEGTPLVFSELEYALQPRSATLSGPVSWRAYSTGRASRRRGTATMTTGPRSSARRRGSWGGSWNFSAASVRRHTGWQGLGTCSSPPWEDVT